MSASGCNAVRGKPLSVQSVIMEDFDLNTALDMVRELERPILSLNIGTIITRSQLVEMRKKYELFFDTTVLYTFFDVAEIEDASKQDFEVRGNTRYPTIFDENIEITKSYIETTVYDLERDDMTLTDVKLHIVLESVGEEDSFNRSYLFTPDDDNGGWQFYMINGTVNYTVDD